MLARNKRISQQMKAMLSREHIEHVLHANYEDRAKSRKVGVAKTFHPD